MSLLLILMPPRARITAPGAGADAGLRLPAEWPFALLSRDGRRVEHSGQAAATLLPRAERAALVLSPLDVAWLPLRVPKVPPARLRAALLGLLEERLLDNDEALHLALGEGSAPGQDGWVAVMHKPWLAAALQALEAAGHSVERVLPLLAPGPEPRLHGFLADGASAEALWLAGAGPEGVRCLPVQGSGARGLLGDAEAAEVRRATATPAAAAATEAWLGRPVALASEAELALAAAASPLNLRQFDLAPRRRATRALAEAARQLLSPAWRPFRWGVVTLLLLQLVGLNALAWQQRQQLQQRQAAQAELLRSTYPGVRAVLDAPLQMQRETERLRAAAGATGDGDLEPLLAAAAAAWPEGEPPVALLRYENGRLTLAAAGWPEDKLAALRQRLAAAGVAAETAEGRVTLAARGAAP